MRGALVGLLITGSLVVAGCGGEAGSSASSDVKRYCDVTRSIFRGQAEPPTDEQMDRWEQAAPARIAGDISVAAAAYKNLNNSGSPDFARLEQEPLVGSFDRIERFNEASCGIKAE